MGVHGGQKIAVWEAKADHSGLEEAASGQLGGQTEAYQEGGPSVYNHGCIPL